MGIRTRIVSGKGQVTIPQEIREQLGIKPMDLVAFRIEGNSVRLERVRSFVKGFYESVPGLNPPQLWKEIEEIAHEDHALHVAREGLDNL